MMGFEDLVTKQELDAALERQLAELRRLLEGGAREAMLSVADAAEELQVNPKTVERLIHAGDLAASQVGRLWRIRRRDLDAFLTERRNAKAG